MWSEGGAGLVIMRGTPFPNIVPLWLIVLFFSETEMGSCSLTTSISKVFRHVPLHLQQGPTVSPPWILLGLPAFLLSCLVLAPTARTGRGPQNTPVWCCSYVHWLVIQWAFAPDELGPSISGRALKKVGPGLVNMGPHKDIPGMNTTSFLDGEQLNLDYLVNSFHHPSHGSGSLIISMYLPSMYLLLLPPKLGCSLNNYPN